METQENQANTDETEKEAVKAPKAKQQDDAATTSTEQSSEEATTHAPSALLVQPLFPETQNTETTLDFNTLSPEVRAVLRQMQEEGTFSHYSQNLNTLSTGQQRFRLQLENNYHYESFEGLRDIIKKKGFCLSDNIRFGDVDAGDVGIQLSFGAGNRCVER